MAFSGVDGKLRMEHDRGGGSGARKGCAASKRLPQYSEAHQRQPRDVFEAQCREVIEEPVIAIEKSVLVLDGDSRKKLLGRHDQRAFDVYPPIRSRATACRISDGHGLHLSLFGIDELSAGQCRGGCHCSRTSLTETPLLDFTSGQTTLKDHHTFIAWDR
eukprot:3766558-Pleurochrysis_carterae.AAC.2